MASALEGLRVVDLTVWFQGPVAAQHLADFGAEVIKVERPKGGDQGRGVRSIKALPVGDWNQYFLVINRNKKSMALDLKTEAGREIMYRLVERSDVFLSNLGAENLDAWQLTWEKLAAINPKLIYATTTGYGPYATTVKPSFDMTVQALTGLMSRLGEPEQPPIYLGMGSGDAYGGLMAAFAILLALWHRNTTGVGQRIDASLYGAQLFLAAPTLQAWLATRDPRFSAQQSRRAARNPLWNTYRAKDQWLVLCVPNRDDAFAALARTLADAPAGTGARVATDARFTTAAGRREHARDLIALLDAALAMRTAGEWMERWAPLAANGVAASPVATLADVAKDAGAWSNAYLADAHCEEVNRTVTVRGMPIGLRKTPGTIRSLGPELGQDTEMILFEMLGYDWDEIGALKAKGAIP
jgi:crotonobetainyl-CoA:carnitine CoA-transferase CaiB-like acyl-CoA transferase